MAGIAWAILVIFVAVLIWGIIWTGAYTQGSLHYEDNDYQNTYSGALARAYDKGWDAADRTRIRLQENEEKRKAAKK